MTSLPLAAVRQTIASGSCRCACTGPATARRKRGDSLPSLRFSPGVFGRPANPVVRLDLYRYARRVLDVLSRRRVNGFPRVVCQT